MRLLVLAFFPAFSPPSSGGEMRLGGLYRALSEIHDVTLLTSTDFGARFEEIAHTPRFRELRFPKDAFWRAAYATLERRGLSGELSGLGFALAVSDPACELARVARERAAVSDAVIHEFPYSEPIFADGCPVPEIYNAHNFEADLLGSIVQGPGLDAALLKLMRLEGNLARRARRVFAASTIDAEKFRLFYGVDAAKLSLCPNGFDAEELAKHSSARLGIIEQPARRPMLLFTGSAHRPNVEAADWLLALAPKLPACDLVLAGGLCSAIAERKLPANVTCFGAFDASQKSALLESADLYLNPVRLGSGTSLKAIEALASNLPIVSTPEGARGLGLIDGVHASIVARGQFVASIENLLSDADGRKRLAAAGREFVAAAFSWRHIAENFARELERPPVAEQPAAPLVLAFNDYSVLEGNSGGIARIGNLHANLQCDVVLLTFGVDFQISLTSSGVLNVTVPKTASHQTFEAAVNDNQPVSINDGVASLFAGSNLLLLEIAAAIALRAHAAIFEHPYMAPALDALLAVRPDLPVIYSAHNVEARHKGALLQNHAIGPTFADFIVELENRLVKDARLIVCCTQQDADYFASSGVPVVLTPNGCSPPGAEASDPARGQTHKAGFLGSSHPPNVEAALFIVTQIAPLLPDVQFEFIGSVCDPLASFRAANVVFHGVVDDAEKSRILASWDVALNPLQSGGGSSLKLPDYMIHGLATLNTEAGARGFPVAELCAGEVVAQQDFAGSLKIMLADPGRLARMSANARAYAQDHLCWPAVTATYRDRLRGLFSPPRQSSGRKKLLVVTYRYTEPSLGGAEEYLLEILKRLRIHFDRIDLAAVDVEQITNKHHFGCQFSSVTGGGARRLGELFDQSRFFSPEQPDEDELVAACRELERIWGKEELALLSPFAEMLSRTGLPLLFSGFFPPENHGGETRRWTSPDFSILLPNDARIFQMAGSAPVEKRLELTLLQILANGEMRTVARFARQIPAVFDVSFFLPSLRSNAPLLLRCKVEEHSAPGDHRPYGVLLEKVSVLRESEGKGQGQGRGQGFGDAIVALQMRQADLAEQLLEQARSLQLERLLELFVAIARRREPEVDAMFAAARGPHSPKMQQWLRRHAAGYDVVLVQGIPFDVIPRSVATLANLPDPPKIVTLPHFHGDDRFYHWRDYYRSFEQADRTLLFSSFIAEKLGDPRKFAIIPGGGVRLDEYGDAAARQAFAKIHDPARPFFLVLGRKTASKGYQQAILAHQILRQSRKDVDLVVIGPDEDGHFVDAEGVFYLGQQSREAIRGALACCLGLVTMSQSESFGIVLCEAWLFGKPVIANRNCYSFRDLVRDGETGFLVGAVQELAAAMNLLADNENLRRQMGRAGFDEVTAKYGWEQVADAVRAEL